MGVAAWMDVATDDGRQGSLLDALPFPIGWELLCDCLPTPDVLRLSCASRDCATHARPCVRRLTVRGSSSSPSTDAAGDGMASFVGLVAACPRVEELQGAELGPLGAAHLGYAWTTHPAALARLRALSLPGCMIGEAGLSQLLPLLPYMPALEALVLDANSLGTRGARDLARALHPHKAGAEVVPSTEEAMAVVVDHEGLSAPVPCARLRVLSLALNGIGAGGAAELAAALVPSPAAALRGAASPCQMCVSARCVRVDRINRF